VPVFEYQAKVAPGEILRGEMAAENAEAVAARLTERGLYPVAVAAKGDAAWGVRTTLGLARKPKRPALVLFTRQMANMLQAGMTLHAALDLVIKQTSSGQMKSILMALEEHLRQGSRFSEACAAHPAVFSKFYANMIRAGEAGGMLALVLDHLADFLEKEEDVHKQIRAALTYPLFMLAMGLLTVSILLTFVIPRLVSMFEEMGQTLPLPTRMLVAISSFLSQHWVVILLALVAIVVLVRSQRAKPEFRERIDRLKLRLPFLGQLVVQGEVTQFARTLNALLAHGVPIHLAFEVVVAACKNLILQAELRHAGEAIRQGGRLGASLSASTHLPVTLSQMIAIAESTNQLEVVLDRIATAGAKDVERKVSLFTRLLEPAMIILIGAVVGFIVFAMMLPIFQMDFVVQ